MILSDSEILKAIDKGEIIIDPFNRENLGPHSYDLRLDYKLSVYSGCVLDVREENYTEDIEMYENIDFKLKPGIIYLGKTVEYTESNKYIPFIDGRSSLARLGINIHITAGRGDIGFKGHWTLEITCVQPVKIYPYMKIAQIYYIESKGKILNPYDKRKSSKYVHVSDYPIGSKINKEFK